MNLRNFRRKLDYGDSNLTAKIGLAGEHRRYSNLFWSFYFPGTFIFPFKESSTDSIIFAAHLPTKGMPPIFLRIAVSKVRKMTKPTVAPTAQPIPLTKFCRKIVIKLVFGSHILG